jgi:hypothetical protein
MAVRISIKNASNVPTRGIPSTGSGQVLRLRNTIRFTNRIAPLRMPVVGVFALLLVMCGVRGFATTYYVSSSAGSDANSGISASSSWQTIAHVNGQTFQPGDSILFKRGDVWNESLTPGSSGSSGNPITFDAYGSGAAPNLTGYYAVPSTAWVLVTGNAWKAALPATYTTINFCQFGSVWGEKVAAATANLTTPGNFYLANGFVYVYAVGSPATFYNGAIVPMALSNAPVININGKSWLTLQHFLVNWFDQYGVYVQGASDHLVFANMEADSMIPQGTQPLGFYVNESTPGPGDLKIYNTQAHLNYDGFRFDGAATGITMVNDKAYANRDGALVDNTSAVTYSYCHFYASSLAVAGSTDVEWTSGSGPIAGAGNIAQDTAPAVQVYKRYPAEITLTVDDAGMTAGADTYYANTVLPIADAAGVPVGVAITVGYPLGQTLVPEFQGWVNAGRDVTAHSISHTYYTNTDALEIQYTGSGTAATLSISNKTLTITVTGASDSVSYNLAQGQAQGTIKALRLALQGTGKFTATEIPTCQGPYGTGCSAYTESALLAQDLADVSGQDVRSAVYHMQLDVTRLTTDEITLSRQWMTTNLTGLPATPVYVYPGGYETTTMQGITAGVPYKGARGALKEDLGVKDTYADGFNAQNITSFGVNPSWMGLIPASLNQKIQALVWKQSVWGVPWGIFWHLNELVNNDPVGGTEITNLIQDFKASGATIQTNTGLVNWLLAGTQESGTDGNDYYTIPATSMTLDFRPTKNSPVVDAGQNLGPAYALDINGVNQNSYGSGWEIGAHVYQGYAVYGGGTGAYFKVGGAGTCSPPQYCAYTGAALVQWPTVPNMGGLIKNGAIVTDTSYPSGVPSQISRCTDITIEPNSTYANQSKSAGLGGSGDAEQLWNANSTMLHFNLSGGQGQLTMFNPQTMVCGDPITGYAITADKNLSNPGSSSVAYAFGGGTFDWDNPLVWYSFASGVDAIGVSAAKYTFNSSGQFTVIAPYVDFQYGLPLTSALVQAWASGTTYASGAYVSYALNSTQAPDWAANHTYALGDVIKPLTNNPLGCGFKVATAGTSSTSSTYEPVWSTSGGSCTFASNGQFSEGTGGGGTVKWRNLGGPPVFTFQLISAGGTSGTSNPFTSITHPDLIATYSDNGLTWENVGPLVPAEWTSFAGVSKNGTRFCSAFSSNTYGNASRTYTDNGDQGSGIYHACYDSSINTFMLLNTATGFQSTVTCSGPISVGGVPNSSCSGGTQTFSTVGASTLINPTNCAFPLHNLKGMSTLDHAVFTWQKALFASGGNGGQCSTTTQHDLFDWQPFASFNAATTVQEYNGTSNHWFVGKNHMVDVGDQTITGTNSGAYTTWFSSDAPGPSAAPLTTWQVGTGSPVACDVNGTWYSGDPLPPCYYTLAYDSHLAWWHDAADDDLGPACGSLYNDANLAGSPIIAPWAGEVVCISTSPQWASTGTIGAWQVWRFTHEFNTGGNPFFDTQFAISQLSNDGKFLAFSSDWNCTLGTITGTTSPVYCGPPWVGGTVYTTGQMVNPFASTTGSGTNYGVYQVTIPGTSSTTRPGWFVCNSGTAGSTVTDANGVQYTCLGAGNGKGEVFVVQLAP